MTPMSIRPIVLLLALLVTMVVIVYNAASAPSPDFTEEEVITVAETDFYHTWQNTREGKTLGRV